MSKVREILRLKYEVNLSLREIAQSISRGKTTVSEVISRAEKAGITWPIEMNDSQLLATMYPPMEGKKSAPEPDVEYIFREMKKKDTTLQLLWEEYKVNNPDGLMYTQYCERYKHFKKQNKIYMHKEHKAGEEMEVDWAGSTMEFIDPSSGEIIPAYIFVAVLPASAYPFVYAFTDQKMPSWIDAHVRTFEFFGGVPKVTVPDNTKTAVIKTDRIDPTLNKTYLEMARHYNTTIIPARAGKPKDKAADESMVGFVSRRIIAGLRNRQFFSIADINKAIREELFKLINQPFQKLDGNRLSAFEMVDKPSLQPLPGFKYEYADWKDSRVQFNYHVDYEGFFYSVHYSHVGRACAIRVTINTVEVFSDGLRIAAHPRNYNKYKRYSSLPEHMPEAHKAVSGWSNERFLSWAETVGPHTRQVIKCILESREYAVQSYRACMGIMRYSKTYSKEIMEATSNEVIEKNTFNFKYFGIIIKQITKTIAEKSPEIIIQNDNVRGSSSYEGGGINA